ncbi:dual specificity mitogen-activated protein kinase kinase 5 isoform X2 [Strongylocentrotus purpuratus]|uniref:mitogen-activated protein kinase kinase n=1 Tax=Strongylocentrotus purpuratus TaxID=7668 RepID=A0A7M7N816_STRPU|nr:dual specificity mitogen-activated protein kinase kinase 5 isoform X1 [Strongylocentrotus purpuratus]XP_030832380.1 dual specificity mitogen-activated protein kinase kinase 5 isoform X2 [Strongylocentrotus purpuratus]|eukprot:XP_786275.3 PREDICTED: dual specificity mitogen-activated protein kinase kinase 5 [Strongylocentrotus purpuratus]
MAAQPLVIRIKTQHGEDVDWTVQLGQLSFHEVLEVIAQVLQDNTPAAFEYEDEDGDRITVRSDDEMEAMINYYLSLLAECEARRVMAPPLNIYPQVKPGGRKNIHNLTVNTRPAGAVPKGADSGISLGYGRHDAELREILASGRIVETDILHLEVLGRGHSGQVYKAKHVPTNNVMAVKVIPLDITPEAQKEILSELQILYKCDSPFIIGFYGAFFTENRISICTEFMDGGSLEMYRCIPESILGRMTVSIVKGLNYLWNLKIMHRDVKPSNILVNTQGEIKLCDFGVSAQLVSSITRTYIGTNAYMAPERVLGDEYGVHSEVWSLGVFLLEMATGRFPYPATPRDQELSPIALLQCIVEEHPPRLPSDKFSAPFVDFVNRCLQKRPGDRPKPQDLMQHPFIRIFADGNKQIISEWVCQELQELRLRGTVKGL